jgi:GDP-L-fucose synthase
MNNISKDSKVFVAGHRGLVGSAVCRALAANEWTNVVIRGRSQLDLLDQSATFRFFDEERPEVVVLAAAKVGGIIANSKYPGDFIGQNLILAANVIEGARRSGVKRFVFLGSSCIYPKLAPQPMREEYLLTGALEPTNEAYAVAKIATLKMCEYYAAQFGFPAVNLMPTNLYGPNDNYDAESSHVLPAFIRKFHEAKLNRAKSVSIWGSGIPRREFLHSDDLANAVLRVITSPEDDILAAAPNRMLNVGVGEDYSIRELAELIRSVVGIDADLEFDSTKPDGAPRKLLDISRITKLGWKPNITLADGISAVYSEFALRPINNK